MDTELNFVEGLHYERLGGGAAATVARLQARWRDVPKETRPRGLRMVWWYSTVPWSGYGRVFALPTPLRRPPRHGQRGLGTV